MADFSRLEVYRRLLRHWRDMTAGKSYWHVPQLEGSQFVPGVIAGYFNDLRGKAAWTGPVDPSGVPLVHVNGALQYLSTTSFQKGLGHWDLWLQSKRSDIAQFSAFEQIAQWALRTRDERAGWRVPSGDASSISLYSAMSQGEGISLLCRAYSVTHCEEYIAAAYDAAQLLLAPVAAGGVARYEREGIILEETPLRHPRTILNGWIFALYGLYDISLILTEDSFQSALSKTLLSLSSMLPVFDAGFWSWYDSAGNLASPFYHRLHIAQLRALQNTFPEHSECFRQVADRFEMQSKKRTDRVRAIATKGYQKLRHPPPLVID